MKKIELTQGKFAIVDDEDFETLSQYKWRADKGNSTFYAARRVVKGKNIRMHRQIMQVEDPKIDVDHKNGNGLDNRRSNLRVCDRSLNNANAKKPKDNKSGYKGVSWDAERRKWLASIGWKNKSIYLGRFSNIEDAANAYKKKAKELFGDFARLKEV